MSLPWNEVGVRFNWGQGDLWHPEAYLGHDWFRSNLHDYDLIYIWHGAGHIREVDGRTTALLPGVCLFLRPGSLFEVWQEPKVGLGTRYVHFDLIDAAGDFIPPEHFAHLPLSCEVPDLAYFQAFTRRIVDLIRNEPLLFDEESAVQARHTIESMIKTLLSEFILACSIRQQYQRRGIAKDHYGLVSAAVSQICDAPECFDMNDYAEQQGYTPDHFRRLFKQVVGQTPHQVLIAARIEQVKYLLRNSELSISDIAEKLGYANVHYLSLQFKRLVGVSPSDYRVRNCD